MAQEMASRERKPPFRQTTFEETLCIRSPREARRGRDQRMEPADG
jgi:hypothetical protein